MLAFRFANPLVSLFINCRHLAGHLRFFSSSPPALPPVDSPIPEPTAPPNRPAVAICSSPSRARKLYAFFSQPRWIRIRRVPIKLPNLPPSWRGRTALLFSDLHLATSTRGIQPPHRVHGRTLNPDIILIPANLFDGPRCAPDASLLPSNSVPRPSACTFPPANHDEVGGAAQYALRLLAPASAFSAMKKSLGRPP